MSTSTRLVADPDSVEKEPQRGPEIKNSTHDIANLAYALWQQRGCPEGSPEEDWLEAEKQVRTGPRQ